MRSLFVEGGGVLLGPLVEELREGVPELAGLDEQRLEVADRVLGGLRLDASRREERVRGSRHRLERELGRLGVLLLLEAQGRLVEPAIRVGEHEFDELDELTRALPLTGLQGELAVLEPVDVEVGVVVELRQGVELRHDLLPSRSADLVRRNYCSTRPLIARQ